MNSGMQGSNFNVPPLYPTSIGYPQSGTGGETLRIIRGNVTGTTGAITAGTGFSVVRNSAGTYTITFTTGFSGIPSIGVTATNVAGGPGADATSLSASSVVISYLADTSFSFIIIGPA